MSQMPSRQMEPTDNSDWPNRHETLERTARVIGALSRIPLVPSPRVTCAVSTALALVTEEHCDVVVAIGSWESEHSWNVVVAGCSVSENQPNHTRSFSSTVVQQPLPPTGITRTFRAQRSELAASLLGPGTLTGFIPMDSLSSVHLTDFGTVVEATWQGLSGDAYATSRMMLSCVMTHAAKVIEGAFPNGVSRKTMLTPMELQVARWLLSGESRRSMAKIADRSTNTISDHIKHLYQKLGVHSNGELFKRLVSVNLSALD